MGKRYFICLHVFYLRIAACNGPLFQETTFASRPYQEYMLELTLQRNTIIFLPTGAGKTYIAIMTIKNMAEDLAK